MAVSITTDDCVGCGSCVDACPEDALELKDEVAVVDADACVDCGTCVDECPNECMEM